jgi:hypothetical protein
MKKIIFIISHLLCVFANALLAQNVGIGLTDPAYKLDIAERIRIRSGGTNFTSPGIWLNNINNTGQVGFMGVYDNNHFGWYGNGGAAWNLLMNITNGNIGIGNQNPAYRLDITDRMRIRSGGGANSAGIYFNKSTNTEASFIGMQSDDYVGFFGVPLNNWGLLMNTTTGNIGIGNPVPDASALLHINLSGSAKGLVASGTYVAASSMPDYGAGNRLMFYPCRGAFRVGGVSGTQWDNANVGIYSTAIGYDTRASGQYATAIGKSTDASGAYSTAIGVSATASGFHSTALGDNSIASGNSSTALGNNSIASGQFSTALGLYTLASAQTSTAMGSNTMASGDNSTALGSYTRASGQYSTSAGRHTIAKGYSSTVVGLYNDSILLVDQTNLPSSTTPLFIVGNGDNDNDRTNAMVVRKDGRVGIGTNSPSSLLHVNGNICYTGSIAACSDIRYKKNFSRLTNALSAVMNLNGIYYNWDKDKYPEKSFTNERQIGFSAQEIESYFPEIVQTDNAGYKAVDYGRLTPVLVEAIKEQQKHIAEQDRIISEMKNDNAALWQKLADLEKRSVKN